MENPEPKELNPVQGPMEECGDCSGFGWYPLGHPNNPEQVQCQRCWGTGKAPSDPSGTDSSSATKEKDLEEPGGVAANTRSLQMAFDRALDAMQFALGYLVLPADIEARLAKERILETIPIINRAKRCLSENGSKSSSATSVSYPKDPRDVDGEIIRIDPEGKISSPSGIEVEKWVLLASAPSEIYTRGKGWVGQAFSNEDAENIVNAQHASLERILKNQN